MKNNYYDYINSWIIQSTMADLRWWLLFLSLFFPWVIWWKIVDRTRVFEILSYGLFWSVMATWLDLLGTTNHLWRYPFKLLDQIPSLLPADIAVIPVLYMLNYQFARTWKSFIIGAIFLAFLFSYVLEPIFTTFRMLEFMNWSHSISFIAFFFLGIVTKGIFQCIVKYKKDIS
ncbi:CBO0543 family protein [Sutcliffiella rhizosphaerae]|nr:CBO0543 family protein [Sutcliffiella rhizosphaerae]